jgi:hypothetical protein
MADVEGLLRSSDIAEVPWIRVGDSRSTFGAASVRSWMGEVFRQANVRYSALWSHGLDGNNGITDGLGNLLPGLTGIASTSVAIGATAANSGVVNRLPVRLLQAWATAANSGLNGSRYVDVYSTAGLQMNSTAIVGSTGGQFFRGDPAQGRNVIAVTRYAVTDQQTGIWASSSTGRSFSQATPTLFSTAFSAPPAAAAGQLLITPEVWTPTAATGTGIRVWHRANASSITTGTGWVWAGTEIRFGNTGVLPMMIADGGWSTTDHLPETTAGRPTNTDWKYSDQGLRQVYQHIGRVAGKACLLEINLGQNQSTLSGYAEWDGTNLNAYTQNVEQVTDRHITALLNEGAQRVVPMLETPWQSTTDVLRITAMRNALRSLALRRRWAFFDLQAELLAAGHSTDANGLAVGFTMQGQFAANGSTGAGSGDFIHAGFAGANTIGELRNAASSNVPAVVTTGGQRLRKGRI